MCGGLVVRGVLACGCRLGGTGSCVVVALWCGDGVGCVVVVWWCCVEGGVVWLWCSGAVVVMWWLCVVVWWPCDVVWVVWKGLWCGGVVVCGDSMWWCNGAVVFVWWCCVVRDGVVLCHCGEGGVVRFFFVVVLMRVWWWCCDVAW